MDLSDKDRSNKMTKIINACGSIMAVCITVLTVFASCYVCYSVISKIAYDIRYSDYFSNLENENER